MISGGVALPLIELAVLLLGCVVVPLDPEDPPARLRLLLEDAELAAAVVAEAGAAVALLREADGALLAFEAPSLLPRGPAEAEASAPPAEPPAFPPGASVSHVFFTSGSTGRPKGCVCTHSNLRTYCLAKNALHAVSEESIVFVASAHTFDPSIGDFFATWAAGACVALAPRDAIASALGACLRIAGATHILTTPALFSSLEATDVAPSDLPKLAMVSLGGELTPQRIVDAWACGGRRLLNVYGVTECTVYQAFAELAAGASPRQITGPFPEGTQLLLAAGNGSDPSAQVQEGSGANGELWILGPQVGLGYARRPELTAERFREVPSPDGSIHRGFRTGDIASAEKGGRWTLLGRRDGMVKLRGRRVELGEIEEALLAAAPDLLRAVAAVIAPGPRLVAWCVPRSEALAAEAEANAAAAAASGHGNGAAGAGAAALRGLLRHLCAERLPPHMVPAAFAFTQALPMTGTGKVSRKELSSRSQPALVEDGEGGDAAPLNTSAERLVAEAWTEILGVPVTSASCHFLALGGDSLAALRVCRRLAAMLPSPPSGGSFGELLPEPLLPGSLLRRPVLAQFARRLQESLGPPFEDAEAAAAQDAGEPTSDAAADGSGLSELLHGAAGAGAADVVTHLLSRGVSADGWASAAGSSRPARTPLHAACANGHAGVARLLLEARAAASAADGHGVLPLHAAMRGGCAEVLVLLADARARLQATDRDRQTALHHGARSGAPLALLTALVERLQQDDAGGGKRPGARGGGGRSGGRGASGPAAGRTLLEARDGWGRTPLHWAVVNGHRTAVSWLLEEGADSAARDEAGETPLAIAERRAQCRAQDRPEGAGASVFGDIAVLLGGTASTAGPSKAKRLLEGGGAS